MVDLRLGVTESKLNQYHSGLEETTVILFFNTKLFAQRYTHPPTVP